VGKKRGGERTDPDPREREPNYEAQQRKKRFLGEYFATRNDEMPGRMFKSSYSEKKVSYKESSQGRRIAETYSLTLDLSEH